MCKNQTFIIAPAALSCLSCDFVWTRLPSTALTDLAMLAAGCNPVYDEKNIGYVVNH